MLIRGPESEDLLALIEDRARSLFQGRHLYCSEAVLLVLNNVFGGGLPEHMVIRLASALPWGLGGSDSVCGAVSGGALALGLFLGRSRPRARDRKKALPAAKELHRRIQEEFGSTCCGILKKDKKQCIKVTGRAARSAADLILERRPELIHQVDWAYLRHAEGQRS